MEINYKSFNNYILYIFQLKLTWHNKTLKKIKILTTPQTTKVCTMLLEGIYIKLFLQIGANCNKWNGFCVLMLF